MKYSMGPDWEERNENKYKNEIVTIIQTMLLMSLILVIVLVFFEIARAGDTAINRSCELLRQTKTVRTYNPNTDREWSVVRSGDVDCRDTRYIYIRINGFWVNLSYMVGLSTDAPEFLPEDLRMD